MEATLNELQVREYVQTSADAAWTYPAGDQLFSQFAGSADYICMTSVGINFWHDGKLAVYCGHDEKTRARYNSLVESRAAAAKRQMTNRA